MFREFFLKSKILFDKIRSIRHFKYIAVTVIFVILITVADKRSMLARIQPVKERNKWEAQKEYFAKEIEKNKTKYNQLKTGDENLEKYAREQYYMQKEDEEVFVIKTEPKKKNTQESKKETH